MAQLNQCLLLPDGRKLGYDEYGYPDGTPLFYFHGTPSSRLEFRLFGGETMAQELHMRVIVPDRPGLGLSDFQAGRQLRDWPDDVVALADHLNLERFAILGYSGGGPYAAACAFAIPQRISKIGIISGAGPFDQPGLVDGIPINSLRFISLAREKPWLSQLSLGMMAMMLRLAPDKAYAILTEPFPAPDRAVAAKEPFKQGFGRFFKEALRAGPRGAQRDTGLMSSPWGFRPHDIQIPVQLWHGEADTNAPPAMGQYMANAIPNSHIEFHPGEGHLSLFQKNALKIFSSFVV